MQQPDEMSVMRMADRTNHHFRFRCLVAIAAVTAIAIAVAIAATTAASHSTAATAAILTTSAAASVSIFPVVATVAALLIFSLALSCALRRGHHPSAGPTAYVGVPTRPFGWGGGYNGFYNRPRSYAGVAAHPPGFFPPSHQHGHGGGRGGDPHNHQHGHAGGRGIGPSAGHGHSHGR